MDNVVIRLRKPLGRKVEALIIDNFNQMFIDPQEYSPSYEGNRTIDPDGTIHLFGSDQTEGRYNTNLKISGDKTTIEADRRGPTAQDVEEILKKKRI